MGIEIVERYIPECSCAVLRPLRKLLRLLNAGPGSSREPSQTSLHSDAISAKEIAKRCLGIPPTVIAESEGGHVV
jgi:hypothetical protein